MITILIGKTFLIEYNKIYRKNYSPKEFFEEVYFKLFYDHPKYMQWVTNSAFVQGAKDKIANPEERINRLNKLKEKIVSEEPDASFAIGFPASDSNEYSVTSGLVTDLKIETGEDDIYYSWIGSGLGIGVAGGYNILINNPSVLIETFKGWEVYRKFLNDATLCKMRGNQINTWNGQWLTYKLGSTYNDKFTFSDLELEQIFNVDNAVVEVSTVNWSNLYFSLSRQFPEKCLLAYIYSLGQMNKTFGFIPMYLKAAKRLKEVFKQLFQSEMQFENKAFQALFGMDLKRACEIGNIGLYALRPENLTKYFGNDKKLSNASPNETNYQYFQTYKTWLVAMLSKNKEQITDYTNSLANLLLRYRKNSKGTKGKNLIEKDLLGAKSKKAFIDSLSEMLQDIDVNDLSELKNLKDEVHLMTGEEFNYFNTLLKFDYTFIEKQS